MIDPKTALALRKMRIPGMAVTAEEARKAALERNEQRRIERENRPKRAKKRRRPAGRTAKKRREQRLRAQGKIK